jgi:hypothetical protein
MVFLKDDINVKIHICKLDQGQYIAFMTILLMGKSSCKLKILTVIEDHNKCWNSDSYRGSINVKILTIIENQ